MKLRWALVVLLLTCRGACATPAEFSFQVKPSGAELVDLDAGSKVAAHTTSVTSGTFTVRAEPGVLHHYRIQRAHFDSVDVEIAGDGAGGWRIRDPNGEAALRPATMVTLPKTVVINVAPADAEIFVPGSGQRIMVAGEPQNVVPLMRRGGAVVFPDGWSPPTIFLVHAGFQSLQHTFKPGELDTDAAPYPATPLRLEPTYGPFSYPAFDAAFSAAVLALVAGWMAWWRPRQRAAQRRLQQRADLGDALRAPAGSAAMPRAPGLVKQVMTTDGGVSYVLTRVLGVGGMGTVYEGRPMEDGERVAVKVLDSQDPRQRQRFAREIRICTGLQHPALVNVLDWGSWTAPDDGGEFDFMVMELLSGQTLRQVLTQRGGPLAVEDVSQWLEEMLRGLSVAHKAGIIHRDLKPENIMITASRHARIMDFGIARDHAGPTLTSTGVALGTPLYMSPEHFNSHEMTPASDIFSLGMVMYEALAGRLPFNDSSIWGVIGSMMLKDPPSLKSLNPRLPDALADLVMRMTARDLAVRYADADAVLEGLHSKS